MNLSTIEIPRARAREAVAEYRREARRTSDPVAAAEYQEIARVYRLAARDELPMIALTPTVRAGGIVQRTRTHWGDRVSHYALPRIAAIRADARYVYTLGVEKDGAIRFVDRPGSRPNLVSGRLELPDAGLELPAGFTAGRRLEWTNQSWCAMVPLVPPKHLPPRGHASLKSHVILWEVDDWTWHFSPKPSIDPALLKHLGGDIYAVLATWDLTPLEQLVLTGRRPE
jgi:hypothetical protein